MQTTLKELLVECQKEKKAPDPLKYPSQILCMSESINFTAKVEQGIASMTLPPLLAKYKVSFFFAKNSLLFCIYVRTIAAKSYHQVPGYDPLSPVSFPGQFWSLSLSKF